MGEVYPRYSSPEKHPEVCRPSRVNGIHAGYILNNQAVKMAEVFDIEKVWVSGYENNRQHGFDSHERMF